jgi:nucleoside-diphosphate-sugar epimerase
MKNERIAILGANGQDGFLSTVLCLERGAKVLAFSRTKDIRLTNLAGRNPSLTLHSDADYLKDLRYLDASLSLFCPTHLFYFASDHGPAGTMLENPHAVASTMWLNEDVPEFLFKTALTHGFGLTLPLSSRIYSGNLEGIQGPVEVDNKTPPNPTDFYGEAKANLLAMSAKARDDGIYVNSPVLFNHDSIFKKKGYVGWAAAEYIAGLFSGMPAEGPRNPSALVDISDAHKVVHLMLDMRNNSNSVELISSGNALPISSLIDQEARALGLLLALETPKKEFLKGMGGGTLIAPTSPLAKSVPIRADGFPWLGLMALSRFAADQKLESGVIPVRLFEALPETYRSHIPGMLHQLSPVD